MLNFASVLDHHAARNPEKVVLTTEAGRVTHREFRDRVNALAAGLRRLGIGRGDVVAMVLYNHPEFLETMLAANRIGAAVLPLNHRLSATEWHYILEHSQAVALLTEPEFVPHVESMADLPGLKHRLVLADDASGSWTVFERLVAEHSDAYVPPADVAGEELHRLMYTSGTTSRPKGVKLSHNNLIWKNVGHILEFALTDADRTLICGPMYHVGGLDLPGIGTLHAGGSLVLMRRFDPAAVLATIARERPTNVWLAPAMMNALLQHPDLPDTDVSSLRFIIGGGEKMPEPLISRITEAFPNAWFSDAYGLTETISGDTFNDAHHMLSKAGSVGRPVMHTQVSIVRDDDQPAEVGELGEIAVSGPKVFSGYWRDDEATARVMKDGWFYTGDIGRLDDEGYLYVEDRKKDVIVSGGENIASPEVERVLYEHPDVVEAAVVGTPHPRWGEVPKAYVVLREAATGDLDELNAFCRQRLAKFKVPSEIVFLPELPRTASGKVLKRDLRTSTTGEQ